MSCEQRVGAYEFDQQQLRVSRRDASPSEVGEVKCGVHESLTATGQRCLGTQRNLGEGDPRLLVFLDALSTSRRRGAARLAESVTETLQSVAGLILLGLWTSKHREK